MKKCRFAIFKENCWFPFTVFQKQFGICGLWSLISHPVALKCIVRNIFALLNLDIKNKKDQVLHERGWLKLAGGCPVTVARLFCGVYGQELYFCDTRVLILGSTVYINFKGVSRAWSLHLNIKPSHTLISDLQSQGLDKPNLKIQEIESQNSRYKVQLGIVWD